MKKFTILTFFVLLTGCSGNIGDPCTDDRECDSNLYCVRDNNDGVCTARCDGDRDCPSNTVCIKENGGICLERCEGDRDCPIELECKSKKRESGGKFLVCIPD